MRRTCVPSAAATAMQAMESATTAISTEEILPTRNRLSARTTGATKKLSMIASTSGISTDRARYTSARSMPAIIMWPARSRSHPGTSLTLIASHPWPRVSFGLQQTSLVLLFTAVLSEIKGEHALRAVRTLQHFGVAKHTHRVVVAVPPMLFHAEPGEL